MVSSLPWLYFFVCSNETHFYLHIDIRLEILQLESSTSTVPDKYTLLHGDTPGVTYKIFSVDLTRGCIRTYVVDYEQISNNLSIKLSRGCMSDIDDYTKNPYYATENIIEPLTLAYI